MSFQCSLVHFSYVQFGCSERVFIINDPAFNGNLQLKFRKSFKQSSFKFCADLTF